jgi:DNA polymerase-3 subunit alpha
VDSRALNKRVLESLIKSGALDSLGWKRSQMMAMADAAIEYGQKAQRDRTSGQKGLFSGTLGPAALPDPEPPDLPEWPAAQLLAFEKETLGYYVSGHPLDRFTEELARFSKKRLAELISDGTSLDCKVAGIVTNCRTRRTKKGELMAIFTLEDLTGTVEAVVFPSAYAKFSPHLEPDSPVFVVGRFEVDENSSKIICSEIEPLAGIVERNARKLLIRAPVPNLRPDAATALYRLCEQNQGETGVELDLYHPNEFHVTIQSSDFVKVKPSQDLIRRIEDICGLGSVRILS